MVRMRRLQIYLEPDLAEALDRLARQRGTSRANLIRQAARRFVREEQVPADDPIFGIIGLGRGEATNVSERHDDYLAEAEISDWSR